MCKKRRWAGALLLVLPWMAWAVEIAFPEDAVGDALPVEEVQASLPPSWGSFLRMEASAFALLPRRGAGRDEGFLQLEPTLYFDRGAEFIVNLGAPFRFRMWGEGAGQVRKEDWDSLSDWGRVVRSLQLGTDTSPLGVWFGALESYSLLSGHLVRRYSNRLNPDYHPAGGFLTGSLGPAYVEAFASDVLGARLTGGELEFDVEHLLFGRPKVPARYTLSVSAVHDWGRAGGASRPVTLAHMDAAARLVAQRHFEVHVLAGFGGKPGEGGAWGAVAGVGADMNTDTTWARFRLEGRRQHGGFRQGFFGPDYELARFQAAGSTGGPLAEVSFPDGYSAYAEAEVKWDSVALAGPVQRQVAVSVGLEAFSWGRVDVDGRFSVQLLNRDVEVGAGALVVA
ncbi:hypothetical protein HUW63_36645, partial [Myxococcus sp. AM001]|nr:hypothetical protein [Myxococcus sp. AM001]